MSLYVFDLDGTLVRSFLVERPCIKCEGTGCESCRNTGIKLCHAEITYDDIEWLPRRRSVLAALAQQGHRLAIATNQTGVAYGYQTEAQVMRKLWTVKRQSGVIIEPFVCFDPTDVERRKPGPGMIHDARHMFGAPRWETIFVGDLPTDEQAARAAGVAFAWADAFFA